MKNHHEADKILFEKQHISDRNLESKFNQLMAIVRNLESNPNEENKERFLTFQKENNIAQDIMEANDDNEELLELDEHDYAFIKATQEELLLMYGQMNNKGMRLIYGERWLD